MTREQMEDWLMNWIADYVLADDTASQEMKVRYPLSEAKITVEPLPGSPGRWRAVALLRLHSPLDQLTTSLKVPVNLRTMTVLD